MGHLNKLHEEYADKGLVVLGVSNEDASKVESWVTEHGAEFPVVIEETDSAKDYGIKGFPSSFVVGADGNIAWSGSPSAINGGVLDDLLKKVVYFPDLPKALNPVRKALKKSKYASAHALLTKTIDSGKLSEEDAAIATKMRDWIDTSADDTMTGAAKKVEKGKIYSAWMAYDGLAKDYKGLPVATRAQDCAKELLADKAHKKEIDAGKKFAKIRKKLSGMSPKKAIKALKPLTGKKYADTEAGKKASKLAIEYEAKK